MKWLPTPFLLATLIVGGGLATLLPRVHAGASDTITVRVHLHDSGSVVIQREYVEPWGWVTADVITLNEPWDGEAFAYGSATLPVEFIPESRWPLPKGGGFSTESVPPANPRLCEWEEVEWDENGAPIRWETQCPSAQDTVTTVTCVWGWGARLGPFESLVDALDAGVWGLNICSRGKLLRAGGLESPSEMIMPDQLKAMVTDALLAVGETRPLEAIPEVATEETPLHSETTYVDFRVLRSGETTSVAFQARGGGEQQVIELEETTIIAIYSLTQP